MPVDARTLVLPRVFPLGELSFIHPAPTHEAGFHATPRLGHGPEYLGVREYRPGDPMRHVHWGLTARHGQIMVREFEEERTRRLAIVVDTERDEGDAWTTLDRSCAVAASLVHAAVAAGHGARLLAATTDGIDVVTREPADGMVRWLARLEPSGVTVAQALGSLDDDVLRGVETAVVITPAWSATGRSALEAAAARLPVDRVVVVAVLDEGQEPPSLDAAEVIAWRSGQDSRRGVRPRSGGRPVRLSRATVLPEGSVPLRVVVALAVELGIVALVLAGAVDAVAAVCALVLAPVGYAFSHRHRAADVVRGEGGPHGRSRAARSPRSCGRSAGSGRWTRRGSRSRRCSCGSRSCTPSTSLGAATWRSRWSPRRRSIAAAGAIALSGTFAW